jgi:hypothetical protein
MRIQSFVLLAGATAAIATETVSLFLIGIDEQPLEGKVIGTVSTTIRLSISHKNLTNIIPDRFHDQVSHQVCCWR